jgi:hypothetical protein
VTNIRRAAYTPPQNRRYHSRRTLNRMSSDETGRAAYQCFPASVLAAISIADPQRSCFTYFALKGQPVLLESSLPVHLD